MPVPRPRKGEKQDAFISRCHRALQDEFPDNAQRNAVCFRQWRERNRRAEVAFEDAHQEAFLTDDPRCFASHIGVWAIEPLWFQQALDILKRPLPFASQLALLQEHGLVRARPAYAMAWDQPQAALDDDEEEVSTPYFVSEGVAIIRLVGQMQKGISKFGGVSTILTKRALRLAKADASVRSILLAIDSPGGTVAGTPELATEVLRTRATKPVHAYIEDLGASAAYWVASQAQSIAANATAQIGSIGVLAVLHDSSGMAERQGLTVHVISTGPFKGMAAPGTKILPEHLAEVAGQVEALGSHFFAAVQEGRTFTAQQLARVSDGRVWLASHARQLGLINKVQSFEDTLAELVHSRPRSARTSASLDAELANIPRIAQGG